MGHDPEVSDLHRFHSLARRVVIVLLASWLVVPLVVGLASDSPLLAALAFGVWATMSSVIFGVWASNRDVPHRQAELRATPKPHSAGFTPQGWALPLGIVRLSSPPLEETEQIDRARRRWAWSATILAMVATAAPLASAITHHSGFTFLVFLSSAYWLILCIGALWWTIHKLRQGEPRPTLDRPASLIGFALPFYLVIADFLYTALLGNDHPTVTWTYGAVLGLVFLGLTIAANAKWIVVTGRRWSLSYSREVTQPTSAKTAS